MAIVRCSRGGKTRALKEIAAALYNHEFTVHEDGYEARSTPVRTSRLACLYVSFNDITSIEPWEQADPLQALLRRIAFAAEQGTRDFSKFMAERPTWERSSFLEWIGDAPCLLLIDELNNLKKLTERDSAAAFEFGHFLKNHFIGAENRYLIFSSHTLGTLNLVCRYLDTSKASSRHVELLDLPLVPTLEDAMLLKNSLRSVREAVYYGLIPGIIHKSTGPGIRGKRKDLVDKALETTSHELEIRFLAVLHSLIFGTLKASFPYELSLLLDTVQRGPYEVDVIRWIPYHLQYVLEEFGHSPHFVHAELATKMSLLCDLMNNSKELSGEGWDALFVLFLLVRGLSRNPDGFFVPDWWFKEVPGMVEVVYNGYNAISNAGRLLGHCKTWEDLKDGVVVPSDKRRMNILYPTHNNFEVYDVIIVFSDGGRVTLKYGYQLNEGKSSRRHKPDPDMDSSFFVQGKSPKDTIENDWKVAGTEPINSFFGVSGRLWAPENWRNFQGNN
ncbi:MAG: hypothetical protein SGILL_006498 [Bacillariaceae sp.]